MLLNSEIKPVSKKEASELLAGALTSAQENGALRSYQATY